MTYECEKNLDSVYKLAGKERTERLIKIFNNDKDYVVKWFYMSLKVFDDQRACDLIPDKKYWLDQVIGELESGVFAF